MAHDSVQLMQVLDRYQTRLHQAGNEAHDEEFEYVRQIVSSPMFHQFLRGEMSHGEDLEISQASQDIISAEFSSEAVVNELTSSEIQKIRLARRKSLKALRNAVMPQSHPGGKKTHVPFDTSPASSPQQPHGLSRSRESSSSTTPSPLKHAHTKSHSGAEAAKMAVVPESRSTYPRTEHHGHKSEAAASLLTNGTDIDTPLEGLGNTHTPRRSREDASVLGPRIRNLSNSTNTLIERLSPSESPVKGHLYLNGHLSSESHPNVHSLGLNRPEMDRDLFSSPLRVLGPNPVLEWDGTDRYSNDGGVGDELSVPHPSHVTHPHLHYTASPTSHRPLLTTTPSHRLTLAAEAHRHPSPAAPPPNNHLHIRAAHRRSRSFEDILNSPEFDPLNFHRTPIPPSVLSPHVENSGTPEGSKVEHFHLVLEKGNEGLGFLVNNREGGEGGLIVQYLSPGGLAERDGHLKRNDIITAINGLSLSDTTHSEAVRLLQSVRGRVQLSCIREQDPAPPSSPSTHAHPPPSPLTLTSHPIPSPTAHSHHNPPSPLPQLSHHHTIPSTQAQPPPSPLSLTSHPPQSHIITAVPQTPPTPNMSSDVQVASAVNSDQPLRQQIRTIMFPSDAGGVGITVAAHGQGGTMVASLLDHGAAKKDGRLSEGDRLLQVNDESVIHMRCDDVVAKLRSLEEAGQTIRLVVAHSERDSDRLEEEGVIPEVMDSSGDEMDEFEVELCKQQGHGLGITIAGLVSEDTGDELKGLYITSINTMGAVGKDGRAKVNDRILRVDGHSLRGLENMEAASVLRNSGNPVRLVFGRPKKTTVGTGAGEREGEGQTREREGREGAGEGDGTHTDDVDGLHNGEHHLHSNGQSELEVEPLGNQLLAENDSLVFSEDAELVKKWSTVMGATYDIKIAKVVKSGSQGGLGICMESTAQLDDMGQPQEGSTRHIVTLVKDGPVKDHGVLQAGDEILQVNSTEVLGLEHDQAIEVVKETPANVMIVVARQISAEAGEEERVANDREENGRSHFTESESLSLTAESDDDKHQDSSAPDAHLTPPTNGGFGGRDISRRFERQSWRERHAEERRRLMHRFDQRREEYERHIRELEDELLQREKEQREIQLLMADEEEEEEEEGRREGEGGRERRRSTLLHPSSSPTKFDYSPYHGSTTFTFPEFTEGEVGSPDTDSSLDVLSPVPGTGFWDPDIALVSLHKGEEGLGFSILDFADPHHEGQRIILIQSLVEGGVAEQDGRLRVGDRLVFVNDVSVINTSLQFAVEQLVSIPHGSTVELGIHHPVMAESDFSDSLSLSPLPTSPRDLRDLMTSEHDAQFFPSQLHDMDEFLLGMETQGTANGGSASLTGLDDLEHDVVDGERGSGLSGEGEGEEREEGEEEGGRGERRDDRGGEGGEWKVNRKHNKDTEEGDKGAKAKKKLPVLESEDDEPPPPYSKTDPQEKKSKRGSGEKIPPGEPPQPASGGANVKVEVTEPARKSDQRDAISPVQLSRISSPPRGLSLSELTRVTPEDQERWRQSRESLVRERSLESLTELPGPSSLSRNRLGGSLDVHESQLSGASLSPPVDTSSPQKPGSEVGGYDHSQVFESNSDTTLVGSQSQSDTGVGSLPDTGSDNKRGDEKVGSSPHLRLQPVGNKKKARRSPKGSRSPQPRAAEGPSRSDKNKETRAKNSSLAVSYAHSQVTNTSSQDSIPDGGLSPDMSDYDHSSELDNDPREIHIAKTSSSLGLSLTQDSKTSNILVKSVKGAMRKDGRIRTGDQILAINHEWLDNVSLAKASKMLKKAASKSEGVTISYLPAPHSHGFSSNSYGGKSSEKPPEATNQQHFPNQPLQPGLQGRTSLHNIPEQDSFVGGQAQNVGMAPPHPNILPPQMGPPPAMSQWTSYPLGPGAAISPMQPPPYNYQLPQPPRQTFGQPLQPVVWQVQQPGSLQLPVGQPAPQQVAWILREPPHYADHLVQQHMMSGAPFSLPQTGPVSVPNLAPPTQVAPPTTSQPPPSLPSQPPPSLPSQPLPSLPSQPPPSLPSQPPPHPTPQQPPQPPVVQTQTSTAAQPRMTKAQSEIKLRSSTGKPEHERRHKSQSGASPRHPPHPYTVYRRRQQQQAQAAAAAAAKKIQTLAEEPSEPAQTSHDYARRLHNMSRDLTHDNDGGGGRQQQLRNSVDREIEEDPVLRKEFPNVEGTLFEVWLNKGSRGLGMSIVANRDDHTPGPRGIVIMGIQTGGVADRSKMITLGDMILKINDKCVIGMSQLEVQEMLMKAAPHVRFVMLRPEGKALDRTPSVDRDIISGLPQVRVVQLQRDNEKGLGFNVVEGGQGGVVTISSITPGGPAELEGTLQPGDQLISIDGQKILGHSSEKARHLLQQARARGFVQLIVTSAVGGEGPVASGASGKNKGATVPESVVLRQKKRSKESSLKSSRRRPVSVDCDSAAVARTTSGSRVRERRNVGGGEHGEKGERGERSGGGVRGKTEATGETGAKGTGNRNSHTLTEKEVEIGFQEVEKHNVILPGRESRITIFKGSQVLGLTVIGGVDTYIHHILIERVIPGSPAATDGRLHPGDRILEVNDVSLSEATCEDALAALQHPSPFIHLTILRSHSQEPLTKENPTSPIANVEKVELVKPPRGGLGLLIQESPDQMGVYVQEVVENQTAFIDGRIKSGDKILAINHNSTVGASQDTVFQLLQACQGKVLLTVQHCEVFSPSSMAVDMPDNDPNRHFSQPPTVKYPFGAESQPPHIPKRDPPPYPSQYSPYLPAPLEGAHSVTWGPMQERLTQPSPPPALHRSGEGNVKYVQLRKGPSGLGFTIVGGAGSSHGDKPIYVNRVLEEGVAGRDRRLHKGDQLLAVNGINFEGVTHQFAAETLKQQSRHGDVELTVLSFE